MTTRRTRNHNMTGTLIKAAFFIYICFSLLTIVWLKAAVVNLEYEIGKLDRLRADLGSEREIAVVQRANFFSMGNVEKVALKRLGMRNAERDNIFFVTRTSAAGPRTASMK
ncbi:MAG TPA: hypothetical protein DDX85_00855 [Nitrospiraceae bacterium]|nr:hypothetical protein [Nitrospiraceae bacterium]